MVWSDEFPALVDLLARDGLLLLPTDTVWSVCASATSPVAIHRVQALKGGQPPWGLTVAVADLDMLHRVVPEIHPRLETLLFLHKRPLTILYRITAGLPSGLCGGTGEWAVRLSLDPSVSDLIRAYGHPLILTSASVTGQEPPAHFGEIRSDILENVDYISPWRRRETGPQRPSTIARLDERRELEFLRD